MIYSKDRIYERKLEAIGRLIYENVIPITDWTTKTGVFSGYGTYSQVEAATTAMAVGDRWVCTDHTTRWFYAKAGVPASYAGRKVALVLEVGGEAIVRVNGQVVSAITSFLQPNEVTRTRVVVPQAACATGELFVEVEAGLNYMEFAQIRDKGATETEYTFRTAQLAVINELAESYYFDLNTAYQALLTMRNPIEKLTHSSLMLPDKVSSLIEGFSKDTYVYAKLEDAVASSVSMVDFDFSPEQCLASLPKAKEVLADKLASIPNAAHAMITFVGQGHIDTAWRWTIRESVRKTAKTLSNVISLMDQYSEFVFAFSQPQLFEFAKDHYPELYGRIKEKVANGQLELVGNTWVEMDTNIPSGESLVRQLLYGTQFFEREFGKSAKVFWMPDVFGYSWALPQIIKRSGMEYFYTSKLCNNDTNRFPYTLFNWQGIDGTRILSYVQRLNYNGVYCPQTADTIYQRFDEKQISENLMMTYGYGDGGGGPTYQMLETGRRMHNFPGLQNTRCGTALEFFESNEGVKEELPVWNDEMYYEFHRGTYTSQANTKKGNRKNELLYRRAEISAGIAQSLWRTPYPYEELLQGYKLLLTNQFHDILPGSSIHLVYRQAEQDYAEIARIGGAVQERGLAALQKQIAHKQGDILVHNYLSWQRSEIVQLPLTQPATPSVVAVDTGVAVASSVFERDGKRYLTFVAQDIPSMGYRLFRLAAGNSGPASASIAQGTACLENQYLVLKLDDNGNLCSVYDKENSREVIKQGASSLLRIFEDKPSCETAWNIDLEYQNKYWNLEAAQSVTVVENTPERGVIRVCRSFNRSTIQQDIVLESGSRRVDFCTSVQWQETEKMLKAEFPVEIHSSKAAYEIQFGAIERPTHWNTTYDRTKFEVCAHKWADLSEGDYGVALLNDCRYGYDIKGDVMRITLLRSAVDPDPVADKGEHTFTYSLYPHAHSWQRGDVVQQGYAQNEPLVATVCTSESGGTLAPVQSFLSIAARGVVIDTVKAAEDGNGLIVRAYEAIGNRVRTQLHTSLDYRQLWECNLMEKDERLLGSKGEELAVTFKPFEIKTFRLLQA